MKFLIDTKLLLSLHQNKEKKNRMKEKKKIELQKEQKQFVSNYLSSTEENRDKSQDDFEKYINLLASGGVVISLTILEKVTDKNLTIKCIWIFFLGVLCFIVTLLLNLISHRKSIEVANYILSEISYDDIEKLGSDDFNFKINKKNRVIETLNDISIWTLIGGVILIFIFLGINISNL